MAPIGYLEDNPKGSYYENIFTMFVLTEPGEQIKIKKVIDKMLQDGTIYIKEELYFIT